MQGLIILMILPFAVLLIATIVISLVANVMATVLTYVIMALSAGLAVFCYAFFGLITVNAFRRQTEMAADLVGAQLLEFPMPMAQALHRLLQLEAGEGRLLQKFVVTYGTGTEAGNFPQLMRLLRSNPIRLTAPDWWRELLRTHPYALRRLSHVIQAIHQALTRTGP
jgi:Zn-dependent protease with chaperone function